jgi:predicted metal-dependent hydrolase
VASTELTEPNLSEEDLENYRHGVALWTAHEFFECHEVFEEMWLRAGDERRFYQGIIQAAAGFYKVQLESRGRGVSLLQTAIAKLTLYPERYLGLDVHALIRELTERLRVLEQSLERNEPLPDIDFPRIELEL